MRTKIPLKSKGFYLWTTEEIKVLTQMCLEGFSNKAIHRELGRPRGSVSSKMKELGLSTESICKSVIPEEEILPVQGTYKCHNCLEEIKLTKRGLSKKYLGATWFGKWFFWHLSGKCIADPNAHERDIDNPGRFW